MLVLGTKNLTVKSFFRDLICRQKNSDNFFSDMDINIEFGGGSEVLFGGKIMQKVSLSSGATVRDLLEYMKKNLLEEREELFFEGETVRAGILVLINDSDWELFDQENYILEANDTISFISTLHGG